MGHSRSQHHTTLYPLCHTSIPPVPLFISLLTPQIFKFSERASFNTNSPHSFSLSVLQYLFVLSFPLHYQLQNPQAQRQKRIVHVRHILNLPKSQDSPSSLSASF